ncbi:MAG TPA: hypothetical protein VK116_18035, partial [Planctomycetota bacterium]|nr:hypothetical protein [Planctomycetota bacterium]
MILLQAPLRSPLAAGESDCSVTARPSWKPTVEFPFEPFRHEGELASQTSTWIKFTILLCEPDKVYFQNSNVFAFHYDFATSELDPFKGMSNEEYDQVTLHAANQQAVLGAVLFPKTFSDWPPQEFGVQLVRQDPYTVDEIVSLVETVSSKVIGAPGLRTFYFPAHEQAGFAREHEEELRSRGVEISTPARWANDDIVYSPGWALGRLRFVESSRIEDAYVSKELLPSDILITDGVPAEIPFVQGIISLEPSTPNSHVAILANNFRVPFVTFISERDNDRALELDGRRVILRAHPRFDRPDVRLIDVEDELDSQAIEELLALKALPPLDIQPVEHRGEVFVPVSEI